MKILSIIIVVILALLAISSGVTKALLMQQDVDFFGQYGFTNPILIAYGAVQILGGAMLLLSKTRAIGALVVAITFVVSLVPLLMSGNIPVSTVTLIAIILLIVVMLRSRSNSDQSTPSTITNSESE